MRRLHLFCLLSSVGLLCGCKVSPPSPLERRVVIAAEHDITVGNRSQKNPLPFNNATLAAGKDGLGLVRCKYAD